MIVFDKLWDTMKTKDVSTYMLREKYNIESRTIRRLKANQNVTTDTLDKLCEILDCDLCEIAEYVSVKKINPPFQNSDEPSSIAITILFGRKGF